MCVEHNNWEGFATPLDVVNSSRNLKNEGMTQDDNLKENDRRRDIQKSVFCLPTRAFGTKHLKISRSNKLEKPKGFPIQVLHQFCFSSSVVLVSLIIWLNHLQLELARARARKQKKTFSDWISCDIHFPMSNARIPFFCRLASDDFSSIGNRKKHWKDQTQCEPCRNLFSALRRCVIDEQTSHSILFPLGRLFNPIHAEDNGSRALKKNHLSLFSFLFSLSPTFEIPKANFSAPLGEMWIDR